MELLTPHGVCSVHVSGYALLTTQCRLCLSTSVAQAVSGLTVQHSNNLCLHCNLLSGCFGETLAFEKRMRMRAAAERLRKQHSIGNWVR
eukprot:1827129-Amphidinium_carterae.4